MNPPSPFQPKEMREVGGDPNATWRLEQCPLQLITGDIWETLKFARFAAGGNWPVSGGVLDQSRWFLDAFDLIESDSAHWLREQTPRPPRLKT